MGAEDAARFKFARFASKTVSYRFRARRGTGVGRAKAKLFVLVEVGEEDAEDEAEIFKVGVLRGGLLGGGGGLALYC